MEDNLEVCTYKKCSLGDKHVFRTPEDIICLDQFSTLLDICDQSHQDEIIQLDIFCYGGSLDVTKAVCNALQSCKATVVTRNLGVAYSGGSMLLLAGDRIELLPHSRLMIHTASSGSPRNIEPENYERIVHSRKDIRDWYHYIYKDFLTEEEIDGTILKGTPMWFSCEDAGPRLERMFEQRTKEFEEYCRQQELPSRESLMKMSKKEILNIFLGEED